MKPGDGSWGSGPGPLILHVRDALLGKGRKRPTSVGGEGELLAMESGSPSERDPGESEIEAAIVQLRTFSAELYELCLLSWMSSEGLEPLLFDAAREARRSGSSILLDHSREKIRLLRKGCARVEKEIHRLAGLARFDLRRDGIYSAALEPDHAVLPALAPHFLDRFSGRSFALVDCRRRLAILSAAGELHFLGERDALELLPEERGSEAERLWRLYFAAAENPGRRNPELQRRFMPERYWKYLVELRT
ncbi:MAG: TIGR03915 family putative DNA repair protein [Rectinemataceae bacterium]